jgi:hypothetical protein
MTWCSRSELPPTARKLVLTAHIVVSVGWVGAVTSFVALAVTALLARDDETVRGVVIAMDLTARAVIVPLSLASLLTGLVQSLGSRWGLFRHYWVLAKLVINLFADVILLMYLPALEDWSERARAASSAELDAQRDFSPLLHSTAALLLLVVATVLAVYKPRGITPYGWRRQQARLTVPSS